MLFQNTDKTKSAIAKALGYEDYESLEEIRKTNPTIVACGKNGDDHDGFPWDDIMGCIDERELCEEEEEEEEEEDEEEEEKEEGPDLNLGVRDAITKAIFLRKSGPGFEYRVARIDVTLDKEKWAEWAFLANASGLAYCSISGGISTLASL